MIDMSCSFWVKRILSSFHPSHPLDFFFFFSTHPHLHHIPKICSPFIPCSAASVHQPRHSLLSINHPALLTHFSFLFSLSFACGAGYVVGSG
jgi:hypothetical protein